MNTNLFFIKLRRLLWHPKNAKSELFKRLSEQAQMAAFAVPLFYAVKFFILIGTVRKTHLFEKSLMIDPIWIYGFIPRGSDIALLGKVLLFLNVFCFLLALIFYRNRSVRILAFISCFFFEAALASDAANWERMGNSPGFTLVAFLFIFLPSDNGRKRAQQWITTYVFSLASISVLSTYAASGLWRLRSTFWSVYADDKFGFLLLDGIDDARSRFWYVWHKKGFLYPLFDTYPWLGWPGMYLATWFELAAFYVAFHPQQYRKYGIMVMLFHLGFSLIFSLDFDENLLLVLVILVCSPLALKNSLRPLSLPRS